MAYRKRGGASRAFRGRRKRSSRRFQGRRRRPVNRRPRKNVLNLKLRSTNVSVFGPSNQSNHVFIMDISTKANAAQKAIIATYSYYRIKGMRVQFFPLASCAAGNIKNQSAPPGEILGASLPTLMLKWVSNPDIEGTNQDELVKMANVRHISGTRPFSTYRKITPTITIGDNTFNGLGRNMWVSSSDFGYDYGRLILGALTRDVPSCMRQHIRCIVTTYVQCKDLIE